MSDIDNDRGKELGAQVGAYHERICRGSIAMMDKRNLLKLMVLALGVSVLLFVFGYPRGSNQLMSIPFDMLLSRNHPHWIQQSLPPPEATVQLQLFDGLVRLNDESEPEAALLKAGIFPMMVASIPSILRPNLKMV